MDTILSKDIPSLFIYSFDGDGGGEHVIPKSANGVQLGWDQTTLVSTAHDLYRFLIA